MPAVSDLASKTDMETITRQDSHSCCHTVHSRPPPAGCILSPSFVCRTNTCLQEVYLTGAGFPGTVHSSLLPAPGAVHSILLPAPGVVHSILLPVVQELFTAASLPTTGAVHSSPYLPQELCTAASYPPQELSTVACYLP